MSVPGIEISDRARLCRTPLVTVAMITYNHGRFIRRAIEGVMEQVVSFEFELIIGDDCSTDDTSSICRELQRKHPDRIRLIWWPENVSHGRSGNLRRVSERCRGKYVAVCEGDDYWTDSGKLQKQVDYLESHPNCTICFHQACETWEDGRIPDRVIPVDATRFVKNAPTLADLLRQNFIPTSSVIYRWNADGRLFAEFPDVAMPGDWLMNLLHARTGEIGFVSETMSVYRHNETSIWTGAWRDERWFRRFGYQSALFYDSVQRLFGVRRTGLLRRLALATVGALLNDPNDLAMEKVERLLRLSRPASIWVFLSGLLSWVYGKLSVVAPSSRKSAFERRQMTWAIVSRNGRGILRVLKGGIE